MAKLIPGIEFDFGAENLLVPPLALGDLELFQERLATFQAGSLDPQSVSLVIDVSLAAMQRNYPDLTRERLARLVDLANFGDLMSCVMDVSGIRRKELEAKKASAAQGPAGALPA